MSGVLPFQWHLIDVSQPAIVQVKYLGLARNYHDPSTLVQCNPLAIETNDTPLSLASFRTKMSSLENDVHHGSKYFLLQEEIDKWHLALSSTRFRAEE